MDFENRKGVYLGPVCKYGHEHSDGAGSFRYVKNSTCCECTDLRVKAWAKTPTGRASAQASKGRRINQKREQDQRYRQAAKERIAAYNAKYKEEHPEWHALYYRVYNARRRAVKKQAIPLWADLDAIEAIYRQAQVLGVHVDHIVPLMSKLVCGLHCEANLQLLPASDNQSKGNRWWPDMPT